MNERTLNFFFLLQWTLNKQDFVLCFQVRIRRERLKSKKIDTKTESVSVQKMKKFKKKSSVHSKYLISKLLRINSLIGKIFYEPPL